MDYKNYDIEDLASDGYFIKWVLESDPEAAHFWEAYRKADPDMKYKIDKAKAFLFSLQRVQQTDHTAQANKLWINIEKVISQPSPKRHSVRGAISTYGIAASISILFIFLAWAWFAVDKEQLQLSAVEADSSDNDEYVVKENRTGTTTSIVLSDGSTVTLENNSTLKYRTSYTNEANREVYLTGEAFFSIAKNPQQPFLVYANEIVTKVLGTSFRVKAYGDEKDIVVTVKEGKVSVFSAKEVKNKAGDIDSNVNGVILTPNQQVVYLRKEDFFNKTLIEKPEIVKIEAFQYNFKFDNTPVKKVFTVLQQAYGVEIIFDEEVMNTCHITVPLGKEPLYEKLKIICRTIGASYELIDAKIVISSKGC